jgi:magnesium chelatase accessory protein
VVDRLLWERDGAHWPHREASRFVTAAGLRWHVQVMGPADAAAPVALLIHGTGASSHSWRGLAPLLARTHRVVVPDLPGHAFTAPAPPRQCSLPAMAQALAALLHELQLAPAMVVGHSAGAAIGARMCLDGGLAPRLLASVNGALLPWQGLTARIYPPLARLMAFNPLVPWLFSVRAADRWVLQRLIDGTGSKLDETGIALYGKLVASSGHAKAALTMMAQWDLRPLWRELPRLAAPLLLIAGGRDRAVAPADAHRVHAAVPGSTLELLPELGHLAHEERPDLIERLLRR